MLIWYGGTIWYHHHSVDAQDRGHRLAACPRKLCSSVRRSCLRIHFLHFYIKDAVYALEHERERDVFVILVKDTSIAFNAQAAAYYPTLTYGGTLPPPYPTVVVTSSLS